MQPRSVSAITGRTFNLNVRTVNNWIRAHEGRDSELTVNDWDAYMRAIYGNEPKKLKAPKAELPDEDEDDRDDFEQSGGEGLSGLLPDKGKTGLYSYKNIVAALEREFFANPAIAPETKAEVVRELIKYLKTQEKNLGIY